MVSQRINNCGMAVIASTGKQQGIQPENRYIPGMIST